MPNREVNVTKRVITEKGLRYCAVVLSANGRIKPDWVNVKTDTGKTREERHTENFFGLEIPDEGRGSSLSRSTIQSDAQIGLAAVQFFGTVLLVRAKTTVRS